MVLLYYLWLIQWARRRLATEVGRVAGGSKPLVFYLRQKLMQFRS
jgi:hypothetical protein